MENGIEITPPKENKMGVMPINRLLLSMSVPMMLSMLVQALYNIVDSIFVAQIGENALAGISWPFRANDDCGGRRNRWVLMPTSRSPGEEVARATRRSTASSWPY